MMSDNATALASQLDDFLGAGILEWDGLLYTDKNRAG
jgi:hypothetical protein